MVEDVVQVEARGSHRLWVRFEGGDEGEIDLGSRLSFTGVFAPLSDPEYFAQVRVDPELGTIVWPNSADLDPVVLHALVTGFPLPSFERSPAAGSFR